MTSVLVKVRVRARAIRGAGRGAPGSSNVEGDAMRSGQAMLHKLEIRPSEPDEEQGDKERMRERGKRLGKLPC